MKPSGCRKLICTWGKGKLRQRLEMLSQCFRVFWLFFHMFDVFHIQLFICKSYFQPLSSIYFYHSTIFYLLSLPWRDWRSPEVSLRSPEIPRGSPQTDWRSLEISEDPQRCSESSVGRDPAEIPRDAGRCPETLRDFRRQRSPETKIPGDPRRSSGISRD